MTVGIENIKIVTVAIGTLSTAIAALIEKGPGLEDLPAVQNAAFALFALKDCQFGDIKAEIMDVDGIEQGVLAKLFADNFNIVADTTEEIIEKGVAFIMMSVPFLISIISQIKPKPVTV